MLLVVHMWRWSTSRLLCRRRQTLDLDGEEECALAQLVDEAHVSVAVSHVDEAAGEVADGGVLAEVVVDDGQVHDGERRTAEREAEVLVPDGLEAVVVYGLGVHVHLVARDAEDAHAHIRIGDVARRQTRLGQLMGADDLEVDTLAHGCARHLSGAGRVEAQLGPQQDVRLEDEAAGAVVGEQRRVQLHVEVHVLEVESGYLHAAHPVVERSQVAAVLAIEGRIHLGHVLGRVGDEAARVLFL